MVLPAERYHAPLPESPTCYIWSYLGTVYPLPAAYGPVSVLSSLYLLFMVLSLYCPTPACVVMTLLCSNVLPLPAAL